MKEYLDVNMLGTIPYLTDGDVKMTESVAMAQYLVEKYGPTDLRVSPDEPDYPSYLNWLFHSDATLTFPQTVVLRYKLQEPGVADAAVDGYSRWFVSRLKLLETTLEDREYLCSDRFTIADICVSYAITLADSLGIEQAFKPNIKRWTDMLFERAPTKNLCLSSTRNKYLNQALDLGLKNNIIPVIELIKARIEKIFKKDY